MVRIYFLGGEDLRKRTHEVVNKEAFIEAGGAPKVLVLPWTTEDIKKRETYLKLMIKYFRDLGAREILISPPSESSKKVSQKIASSDLIYLPGGDPEVFMKYAKGKRLENYFSRFTGVIIGNSAGAMVLCKEFIIIRENIPLRTKILSGLGLADFSVDVHYNESKDNALKQLSKGRKIYAIPEKSAIMWDRFANNFKFFGTVYLFENGVKRKIR